MYKVLVINPILITPQKTQAVDYCIRESTLLETMKQKMVFHYVLLLVMPETKQKICLEEVLSYVPLSKHTATKDWFCLLKAQMSNKSVDILWLLQK